MRIQNVPNRSRAADQDRSVEVIRGTGVLRSGPGQAAQEGIQGQVTRLRALQGPQGQGALGGGLRAAAQEVKR